MAVAVAAVVEEVELFIEVDTAAAATAAAEDDVDEPEVHQRRLRPRVDEHPSARARGK